MRVYAAGAGVTGVTVGPGGANGGTRAATRGAGVTPQADSVDTSREQQVCLLPRWGLHTKYDYDSWQIPNGYAKWTLSTAACMVSNLMTAVGLIGKQHFIYRLECRRGSPDTASPDTNSQHFK